MSKGKVSHIIITESTQIHELLFLCEDQQLAQGQLKMRQTYLGSQLSLHFLLCSVRS